MDNKKSLCFYAALIMSCSSLFLYQAYQCISGFINQTPITYTRVENQELHPLPSICISPKNVSEERYSKHNISQRGYNKEGIWKSFSPNYDEKQTYDDLSLSLEDLLSTLTLRTEFHEVSENYVNKVISITNKSLPISRCDYYEILKCYCFDLSDMKNTFGIQDITLKTAQDAEITVVPKNQYFGYIRKLSLIFTTPGYDYTYIVDHYLSEQLPVEPDGCSHEMNWKSNSCILRYIHEKIYSRFNCTTPWLLTHSRWYIYQTIKDS